MRAFAVVQSGDDADKQFWLDIWNDETQGMQGLWRFAFYGLLKLNPALAFAELPKLLHRLRMPYMQNLILYLYEADRAAFIKQIASMLVDGENEPSVSGKTINILVDQLYNGSGEAEVNALFEALQKEKEKTAAA